MDPASFAPIDAKACESAIADKEALLISERTETLGQLQYDKAVKIHPFRVLPQPTTAAAPARSVAAAEQARKAMAVAIRDAAMHDFTEEEYQAEILFERYEFADDPGREEALKVPRDQRMYMVDEKQCAAWERKEAAKWQKRYFADNDDDYNSGEDDDDYNSGEGEGDGESSAGEDDARDDGYSDDDDVRGEGDGEGCADGSVGLLPTTAAVANILRTLRVQQRVLRQGTTGDTAVVAASVTFSLETPTTDVDGQPNAGHRRWLQVRIVAREDVYPAQTEGADVSGRDESVARIYFRAGEMGVPSSSPALAYAGHSPFVLALDELDTTNRGGEVTASSLVQPLSDDFLRALVLTFPSVDPELALYAVYLCAEALLQRRERLAWNGPFDPFGLGEWPEERHGAPALSDVQHCDGIALDEGVGWDVTGLGLYFATHALWLRGGETSFAGVPFCTHAGALTRDLTDNKTGDFDDEDAALLETAILKFRLGVEAGAASAECALDCGCVRGYFSDMTTRKRKRQCTGVGDDAATKRRRSELNLQPDEMDPQNSEWWLYPGTLEHADPAYETRRLRTLRDYLVWICRRDSSDVRCLAREMASLRTRDEYEGHDGSHDLHVPASDDETPGASDVDEAAAEEDVEVDEVLERRFSEVFGTDEHPPGRTPGWEIHMPNCL